MRRLFMLIAALAVAIEAVPAFGAPENAYVGVLGDAYHSVCCIYPAAYVPFSVWILWLPSARGMQAAAYNIALPSNVIVTSTVTNPAVEVRLGCIGYFCTFFSACQNDWVWTHQFTCMVMAAGFGVPAAIGVVPASGSASIEYASCEPGYPLEPVTVWTNLNLYQPCWVADEPSSWGAIKSLFR
jgi:hypothetical protein